jgi:hypothetical protein
VRAEDDADRDVRAARVDVVCVVERVHVEGEVAAERDEGGDRVGAEGGVVGEEGEEEPVVPLARARVDPRAVVVEF